LATISSRLAVVRGLLASLFPELLPGHPARGTGRDDDLADRLPGEGGRKIVTHNFNLSLALLLRCIRPNQSILTAFRRPGHFTFRRSPQDFRRVFRINADAHRHNLRISGGSGLEPWFSMYHQWCGTSRRQWCGTSRRPGMNKIVRKIFETQGICAHSTDRSSGRRQGTFSVRTGFWRARENHSVLSATTIHLAVNPMILLREE
jgi:hypothetical protein